MQKDDDCIHCNGTGKRTCSFCGGLGRKYKMGIGYRSSLVGSPTMRIYKCYRCDSTGKEKCRFCNGTGKQTI